MKDYKESGTQGIGLIPHSWNSKQLGIFFSENRRANSYLQSVTALQFKYGEIIQKPSNGRDLSDKDKELLSKYTVIEPGDVVVNGLNLNFDLKSLRIAIARENGIITSAYIVLRPRKGVNSEYYNYVLKALDFQKILHGMGEGIRLTLSYEELKKLNVPAPDAAIQAAIVSYLDEKCGEIDSLIGLQEHMIEKLKAYKQSVITEAVTKGLNPNAKLIPSGIDWIGNIPEGWKVVPLKWILRNPLQYGANESGVLYDESLPRYVRITDILNNNLREDLQKLSLTEKQASGYILEDNDILFARSGATVGKAFIYKSNYGRCAFAGYLIRAQINSSYNSKFIYYYTQSSSYDEWKKRIFIQSTIQNIGADRYSILEIPIPLLPDQQAIVNYLDEKCADIDHLIAIKQQKIDKLKDYKKSVIFEAVTGKTIIE